MVFQMSALFDSMNVFDNVAFPLLEHTRLSQKEVRERVMGRLDALGVAHASKKMPAELSGGMQKRVAVARALVLESDIIIYDEPTTGLDPTSRQAVWEEVRSLNDEGTTVFLTTQYLEEADQLAGRIAIIDGGTIVREGDPAALKEAVGDPTLRLEVADPARQEAARGILAGFGGERPARAGRIAIGLRGGTGSLASVIRALDEAGITVGHVEVDSPSLDDVFADATGRRLEGAGS